MAKSWIATEEHADSEQDVTMMEVPSETLEADLVEVTGLDKDIETLVADGEELEHDQGKIEELAANAEASLEEDGMDETAARATEIAAESFTAKWGIKRRKVGLESFGTSDGRRAATQIAVESLKDAAVGMWDTFVKWLKELVAKAKEQILKLTNAGKSMKARSEKLSARLDKGLGAQDKKEVEGSFTKMLAVDEKVDYAECLKFADSSAASVDSIGKAIVTGLDETGKLIRGDMKQAKPGQRKSFHAGTAFGKKTQKKLSIPQGASEINVVALPGNCYLTSFTHNGVATSRFDIATEKVKDGKLPTLDAAGCKSGVDAVYKIGEVLETKLKAFGDANKKLDALADAAKTAKDANKEATSENKDELKLAMNQARADINAAKASERAVTTSMKNAGTGIANYVAASIAAYKKV